MGWGVARVVPPIEGVWGTARVVPPLVAIWGTARVVPPVGGDAMDSHRVI